MKERRKHFLINKPLQFRYMGFLILILSLVSGVVIVSLYFGIWGSILDAFSDSKIREDLLMASRLSQYEEARLPAVPPTPSALSFFKQADKLSRRQQEIFKEILDETNRRLISKLLFLLILIAWGSIYLSHKIAGPLYRFYATLGTINNGDLRTRVHLRHSDEAKFVGVRFNQTVENLDFLFSRIKNIIRENESDHGRMTARLKEELAKIKTSADR